jgi:hypothetical protein
MIRLTLSFLASLVAPLPVVVLAVVVALSAGPIRVEAADPAPGPTTPVVRPIFFAAGAHKGTVGGRVQRGEYRLYSLAGEAEQLLTVTITAPGNNAVFEIYPPGTKIALDADGQLTFTGKALHDANALDPARWSGRLPDDGTYIIAIGSTRGSARYSMDVKIE